ncbi:MAG: hypothetical protein RR501_01980 [Cloacibacillus sp.]
MQKNKKVLFSPVGSTDPIANCRDGALLHIARLYRPSKIIIYFSDEMLAYENKDRRYTAALELLGEKLGHSFEIEIQRCPFKKDVHKFDPFYEDLEKRLLDIKKEDSDTEILLNVSSGTPAMKSALQMLSALGSIRGMKAIQVATPEEKSNTCKDVAQIFDLETEWGCNADNDDATFIDRSELSSSLNLTARIKKESIFKHIAAFDYTAALSIAEEMEDKITPDAMNLLRAAAARQQLNLNAIPSYLKNSPFKIIPVEEAGLKNIAEYLLWLDIKIKRQELADFIRGITPLIADLFEYYMQKHFKIDMKKYCEKRGEYSLWLTHAKLETTKEGIRILEALDCQFNGFKDGYLSSENLLCAVKAFCSDKKTLTLLENIRKIESAVRNIAAHEIIAITPELIEKKIKEKGLSATPKDILKMLFEAAELCGVPKGRIAGSYSDMNRQLKDALIA